MRLFIAVPVPPNVCRALYETQKNLLANGTAGRYVPTENFHITLKFLGELPECDLASIAQAMREAVSDVRPIPLRLAGYDTFTGREACTGHVRVEDSRGELERLYVRLESALTNHGFRAGRQRFLPHITLGRNMGDMLFTPTVRAEPFTADRLVLYESRNNRGRMEYTPLHREVF